jgi:AcrR family transcriptional regulator
LGVAAVYGTTTSGKTIVANERSRVTDQEHTAAQPRRGRADKFRDITRAARAVFGREGYARASVDAIAAEAQVSTRTIYNHFDGKEQLFRTVIQESATAVADAHIALIDRRLQEVSDLERDLTDLALDWLRPEPAFADHRAMVQQIRAEAAHFPRDALQAWQDAGPRRVQQALADRLRSLADRGTLHVPNPDRAALHFAHLIGGELADRSFDGVFPLSDQETTEVIAAGVQAFLNGYAPR